MLPNGAAGRIETELRRARGPKLPPAFGGYPVTPDPNDPDIDRLVAQLKREEIDAEDARLSSVDSFALWVQTHPVLGESTRLLDYVSRYGPAFLDFIRALV